MIGMDLADLSFLCASLVYMSSVTPASQQYCLTLHGMRAKSWARPQRCMHWYLHISPCYHIFHRARPTLEQEASGRHTTAHAKHARTLQRRSDACRQLRPRMPAPRRALQPALRPSQHLPLPNKACRVAADVAGGCVPRDASAGTVLGPYRGGGEHTRQGAWSCGDPRRQPWRAAAVLPAVGVCGSRRGGRARVRRAACVVSQRATCAGVCAEGQGEGWKACVRGRRGSRQGRGLCRRRR